MKWKTVIFVGVIVSVFAVGTMFSPLIGSAVEEDSNCSLPHTPLHGIIADELDITLNELQSEIKSGKTIEEIAKEKNVSVEKLTEAIITKISVKLDQSLENGSITEEQKTNILERLEANINNMLSNNCNSIEHNNFKDRKNNHGCSGIKLHETIRDTIAEELGLTSDELRSQILSGKTIEEMAKEQNVSLEDLTMKLKKSLTAQIEQMVENGTITEEQKDNYINNIDQCIENMIKNNRNKSFKRDMGFNIDRDFQTSQNHNSFRTGNCL